MDGSAAGASGLDAAIVTSSKAATSSKAKTGWSLSQSSAPAAPAVAASSATLLERSTPTRVTPSMSSSEEAELGDRFVSSARTP